MSESRHKDCKPRKAQWIRLNEGKISFLLWKCQLYAQECPPVLPQRYNSVQNENSEYLLLEKLAFFCETQKEGFSRMLTLPLSMQLKCIMIIIQYKFSQALKMTKSTIKLVSVNHELSRKMRIFFLHLCCYSPKSFPSIAAFKHIWHISKNISSFLKKWLNVSLIRVFITYSLLWNQKEKFSRMLTLPFWRRRALKLQKQQKSP